MKCLLDTHIFIGLLEQQTHRFGRDIAAMLENPVADFHLSVASLWEIAIKSRLGKLPLNAELEALPQVADRAGIAILAIRPDHVVVQLKQDPPTRDPFDRLLLAQCQLEGMRLVTVDRALVEHPLAIGPRSS
ncbi:twitching motility protein PilT [Bosea sp. AAP35]|uniref:type II toxin-antitoxin system VapC family toxin n=1 Tax=Bosea sp. AAP35 TaxID=1523417 RepID=UPI0006B9F5F8|nr:type II toxin-antitoxin system VapC family toxin [Bosea sp. AAP35]KPF72539.1 twitching motility protein PilT [Bosea sp. AAP35]